MKIEVNVTKEDIIKGVPKDGQSCPIALALLRATGADEVDVTRESITIDRGGVRKRIKAPETATAFIDAFDYGYALDPISFTLEFKETP